MDRMELIEEVHEKYSELTTLSPNHELLRYFVQRAEEFRINPDKGVTEEFTKRFRTGLPHLDELKKQQKNISFAEYEQRLTSTLLGNYLGALEQRIKEIVSRN